MLAPSLALNSTVCVLRLATASWNLFCRNHEQLVAGVYCIQHTHRSAQVVCEEDPAINFRQSRSAEFSLEIWQHLSLDGFLQRNSLEVKIRVRWPLCPDQRNGVLNLVAVDWCQRMDADVIARPHGELCRHRLCGHVVLAG